MPALMVLNEQAVPDLLGAKTAPPQAAAKAVPTVHPVQSRIRENIIIDSSLGETIPATIVATTL